ncbi:MAG: MFS transporter [Spongiibacteraceae bacterium]
MTDRVENRLTGHAGLPRYTLLLLMLVYTCHMVDRTVVIVLLEPIKHEFGLSDTQLGLFSGLAFALGAVMAGVPLGAMADRVRRKNLLAGCVALWSALTMLCGLAPAYLLLLLSRFGVGAAEAGGQPTIMSIVGDAVPAERRASAVGIVHLGIPFGMLIGFLGGGYIAAAFGWRSALLLVGFPGLVLAAVVHLTLKEPLRENQHAHNSAKAISLREFFAELRNRNDLRQIIFGLVTLWFCTSSYAAWLNSFFIRTHHLDLKTAGTVSAVVVIIGGIIGNYLSGKIADRVSEGQFHRLALVAAIAALIHFPLSVVTVMADDFRLVQVTFLLQTIAYFAVFTPANGLAINLATSQTRGRLIAVISVGSTLIGYGLGPQVVGLLSDYFSTWMGANSLRYALLVTMCIILWSAVHFLLAARALHSRQIAGELVS